MCHVLRSIGWQALQLDGGYKAWRGQVIRDLNDMPANLSFVVICGRTGSGKSRLLEALDQSGRQVLDLEKLAAHRGSVLGDIPDERQPSQKMFETRIWHQLSGFEPGRPVYVEAESKRVGALRVPDALMEQMRTSICIELKTPRNLRVELLCEEYQHLITDTPFLFGKLDCLKGLQSNDQIEKWRTLAQDAQWQTFVEDLLINHYDPAYDRSMFRNFTQAANAQSVEAVDISQSGFAKVAGAFPL
jgi:tRNA 2-selenouridine synthase